MLELILFINITRYCQHLTAKVPATKYHPYSDHSSIDSTLLVFVSSFPLYYSRLSSSVMHFFKISKDQLPIFSFIYSYYAIVSIVTITNTITVWCEQVEDHVTVTTAASVPAAGSPELPFLSDERSFFRKDSFLQQPERQSHQPHPPLHFGRRGGSEEEGRILQREKRKVDAAGNSFEIAFIIDGPNKVSLKQKAQQLVF